MKYTQLDEILKSDNKDLADKIFEKDGFSFNENIIIDQLDNYKGPDADELFEDARKFGCIIRLNDNNVMLPAGLKVKIYIAHKESPVLFYVERNGVAFPINYVADYNDEINVTFTEFGQKLYAYASSMYTTINAAYDQLKFIEQVFGVKIIEN